ncbi:MAG: PilZ domain-containing protein [Candidatus Omnitrophica bacterium]|nr:PilZ domain-containing protein [Candidatus Omnitrophota bacterium]
MDTTYQDTEKREFERQKFVTPLSCKVCKKETISKILEGYTSDISQSGLSCSIQEKVNPDDILWLSFDRATLNICEELEKKLLIYQNGIIAKVIRINPLADLSFEVGVSFITREEKNVSNIYPKIHFLEKHSHAYET